MGEAKSDPPCPCFFLAAARGGYTPPLFLQSRWLPLQFLDFLGSFFFCNFYVLEYGFKLLLVVLFNFCICLTCNYIWVYEKTI